MRRFEFSDGKSDKFWEIVVEGNAFTARYGRVGTDGQVIVTVVIFFSSSKAARCSPTPA